jgi:hypothetical protein
MSQLATLKSSWRKWELKSEVYFGSHLIGSRGLGYINGNEITFEITNSISEVCGSGRSEFWGLSSSERYIRHLIDATVVAINDEAYDTSLHGSKEQIERAFRFKVCSEASLERLA